MLVVSGLVIGEGKAMGLNCASHRLSGGLCMEY